jgi:hypothetical protein
MTAHRCCVRHLISCSENVNILFSLFYASVQTLSSEEIKILIVTQRHGHVRIIIISGNVISIIAFVGVTRYCGNYESYNK